MMTALQKHNRRVDRRNALRGSRPHIVPRQSMKLPDRPFNMERYESGADVTKAKRKRFEMSQMPGAIWSWLTAWKRKKQPASTIIDEKGRA